ncbi:hypothetical protein BC941DRAFT_351888 [Chlamydoabsidia padenii]|nr:hypothetical protein BC941DRAFT_351888 [Chlamydoabsidia padenii]
MLRSILAPTTTRRLYSTQSRFLNDFMATKEKGPVQLSIEHKVMEALEPTVMETVNESHLHAHHSAMKGNTNKETHFNHTLMQRHRMIYGLLGEELQQGLHALTLKTKTQNELDSKK